MEIHKDWEALKLYLPQKYIKKVLEHFRMQGSKPLHTLVVAHFKLSSTLWPQIEEEGKCMSNVPYASIYSWEHHVYYSL